MGTEQISRRIFTIRGQRVLAEEKTELVANCDRFERLKHSTVFPLVFTDHGAIMAASVLNSKRAVETSIYVVRAFVRMREALPGACSAPE